MYYRAAEYYDDPVTDTSRAHGVMSRDLFLEAVRLMPWTTEVLQIPFEHVWLPGYFMRPAPPDPRPRKTIIVLTASTERRKNSIFKQGPPPLSAAGTCCSPRARAKRAFFVSTRE